MNEATPMKTETLEQLLLLATATWDGNLISKDARDNLVRAGLVQRARGYNWLTVKGLEYLVDLQVLTTTPNAKAEAPIAQSADEVKAIRRIEKLDYVEELNKLVAERDAAIEQNTRDTAELDALRSENHGMRHDLGRIQRIIIDTGLTETQVPIGMVQSICDLAEARIADLAREKQAREEAEKEIRERAEDDSDELWLGAIARHWKALTGEYWDDRDGESREEAISANVGVIVDALAEANEREGKLREALSKSKCGRCYGLGWVSEAGYGNPLSSCPECKERAVALNLAQP